MICCLESTQVIMNPAVVGKRDEGENMVPNSDYF